MSRDSLYGSLPVFREGETPHAVRHTRSPSWTPITPLMLPSPFGAGPLSPPWSGAHSSGGGGGPGHSRGADESSGADSDSSPPETGGRPLFIRKISDLDLTRPSSPALKAMAGHHGGGAGSMGGNDHLIIVEEDEDDDK